MQSIHTSAAAACRATTFKELQSRLVALRLSVYEALAHHGPCTTRELALECGLDLLTVRPRITELVQLGFVVMTGRTENGHEGIYRALTLAEAEAAYTESQRQITEQLALAL